MATNPITIKRYNGSSWDTLNPITVGQNVYGNGTNSTTALLDSNDKINSVFLPSSVTNPTYYEHNIRVAYSSSNFVITFKVITTDSTAYTYSTLTKSNGYGLYALGFTSGTTVCSATGFYGTASAQNLIIGVYGYNSTSTYRLYFRYLPLVSYSSSTATINNTTSGETTTYITLTSSFSVTDYVRTL